MSAQHVVTIAVVAVAWVLCFSGCGGQNSNPRPESSGEFFSEALRGQPNASEPVAEVDGSPIGVEQLRIAIESMPEALRQEMDSPEQRLLLVEQLINRRLLARRAVQEAIAVPAEDMAKARDVLERSLSHAYLGRHARNQPEITVGDEECRKYYESNQGEYTEPERMRLARILIKAAAPGEKARARDRMKDILERFSKGQQFEALAATYGEGEEKSRQGDVGWVLKNKKYGPAYLRMWKTEVGSVGEVQEDREGLLILKKLEQQPERVKPFEEVKESIRVALRQKQELSRLREFTSGLRESARIQIHKDEIDRAFEEALQRSGNPRRK
ncbi:MAG: hypothetical protein C4523_07815 [Myxococcales bacterium]|nr:MAG: hypothetical protein C4523_07815 [Myxococcales bacterium]